MRFLVIGLGSMGKRRIRCLRALGISESDIYGFDTRMDRCNEARNKYKINIYNNFTAIKDIKLDAFIISVPPDFHHIYMKKSIELRIPFFVEASVVDYNMKKIIKLSRETNILAAPSATLMFHPAIKIIKNVLEKNELGTLSNVILHSGQYLPDWHTYEKVSEYYVSQKETGGAREIVPFEMTWFIKLLGFPEKVCGIFKKTIRMEGAEKIDDTYNFLMDYKAYTAMVTVDVVSRYATRRLLINGDRGQLRWDWDNQYVEIFEAEKNQWKKIPYEMKSSEKGYNPNIGENMYIDEIRNFINAIQGKEKFINTLEFDYKILQLLYSIEKSYLKNKFISIKK